MRMKSKLGWLVLVLLTAQLALILLSWVLTAAFPELPIRSLLSSEGIRWFFGCFSDNQLSPLLVALIMAAMHGKTADGGRTALHYRERVGLRLALLELLVYAVIMLLLTAVPHAILLSVTGHLFPSAFSSSLIPSLSSVLVIMSLSYGVASGTVDSVAAMHRVLVSGLLVAAHLVPAYVIGIQLYMSLLYVLVR